MPTMLIPELEETKLTLNFKDGQEPLILDVVDLDRVTQAMPESVPEGSSWEREYAERFELFFNRRISRSAAKMLWQHQVDTMNALKKIATCRPYHQVLRTRSPLLPKRFSLVAEG